ncbi:MAG: fatty acid desaturase [Lewinella sp.]|nr:fatty acid desaturase [Lewinella sp.]
MQFYTRLSDESRALKKRVSQIPIPSNLPLWRNFLIGLILLFSAPCVLFVTPELWQFHPVVESIVIFLFAGIFAIGFLLIGTTQHHGSHGGFSQNPTINYWISKTIFLMGMWDKNWRMQHVVLHHTYTNLYNKDPDVRSAEAAKMIFSPFSSTRPYSGQARKWFVFFIYGLTFIVWLTYGDFRRVIEYHGIDRRQYNNDKSLVRCLLEISIFKICYFGLAIALPLYMGTPWYIVIPFLLIGLWLAGSLLMPIFQMAHISTKTRHFHDPNELPIHEEIDQYEHAMLTTVDFYFENKFLNGILTNLFGYLNYQVVHHIFPGKSPLIYPEISRLLETWYDEVKYFKLQLRDAWKAHLDYLVQLTDEEFITMTRSGELREM